MIYAAPGTAGAKIAYKAKYDNFINGRWTAPVKGQYFDVVTPVNGKVYTQVARSSAEDIELALDAAHDAPAADLPLMLPAPVDEDAAPPAAPLPASDLG